MALASISSTDGPYEYRPIEAQNEIRLLSIHEALGTGDPISCSISVYQTGSTPEYEALSYTWGDLNRSTTIRVDGKPVKVTENCERALCALRNRRARHREARERNAMAIWVDAVCINQENIAERNAQVARMSDVYGRACRTVIYLGETDEHWQFLRDKVLHVLGAADIECLRACLRNPGNREENVRRQFWSELAWSDDDVLPNRNMETFPSRMKGPKSKFLSPNVMLIEQQLKTHWNAFFARPWFSRAWIVQEVMNALELTFLIGGEEYPWSMLEDSATAVEILQESQPVLAWDVPPPQFTKPAVVGMRQVWGCIQQTSPDDWRLGPSEVWGRHEVVRCDESTDNAERGKGVISTCSNQGSRGLRSTRLFEVLQLIQNFECQDPRDRLFSLVSLFGDSFPKELMPDYSQSTEEVYANISWFLIRTNAQQALGAHETFSEKGRRRKLPSWAIDWDLFYPAQRASSMLQHLVGRGSKGGSRRKTTPHAIARRERYLAYENKQLEIGINARRDSNDLILEGFLIDHLDVPGGGSSGHLLSMPRALVLGPSGMSTGDVVCIFTGIVEPFVLREAENDIWTLVGPCYAEVDETETFRDVAWSEVGDRMPTPPFRDFRIR